MTRTAVRPGSVIADNRVLGDWVRACVAGELVGFVPPAIAGALLVAVDAPEVVLVLGLVIAGIVEGVVLGFAQNRVITQVFPSVTGWVAATAMAAGIAWLAGMGGSSLVQQFGPKALIVVGPAWVIGLLAMGVLQSRCLRSATLQHRQWIGATSVAWFVGVMIPVFALSIVPNGWPLVVHILVGVAAAVAMGATVGIITGRRLVLLAGSPHE